MDRDRVTQLLDEDDDSLSDYGEDGLRSPLRCSSIYNQLDSYPSFSNHSTHHEPYQGGDQTLVSMLQHQQAMLQKLISQQ